jgi:hypothetical protein
VGFSIELKSNSVRRGSDLLEFSSWIRGNCGRIVGVEVGDDRFPERADDDGQCVSGSKTVSFG